jgi:hypothetical protein
MSFGQGQAKQQDTLDAQSQMATLSYFVVFGFFLTSLFVFCRLCFCAHAAADSSIIPFPVRM